jgi:hypothetical protein
MTNKKEERRVNLYVQGLFKHGLELYDSTTKNTLSKGVINPGGAKLYFHQNFRTPQTTITFNHKGLEKAIKEAPVILYALNRVELNEEGNPQMINGSDYKRIYTGLMLYLEYEDNGTMTQNIRDRLIESVKEVNLSNYIEVGTKIDDPENKLSVISSLKHENFARELVPLQVQNCIFLALPSGAPGSAQFWSFTSNRSQGRSQMSQAVTANTLETDNLPF